jgi:hypothetical protein
MVVTWIKSKGDETKELGLETGGANFLAESGFVITVLEILVTIIVAGKEKIGLIVSENSQPF